MNRLQSFARRRDMLERAVDVWLADPAALIAEARGLTGCLCDAERERLYALRFERDRALYLAAHVFLRHVLSLYRPAMLPVQWRFETSSHGRPEIKSSSSESGSIAGHRLRFSLSHTDGLVAVTVAHDWDVGVDVERARPDLDLAVIAPALLSGPERKWFPGLPEATRESAFIGLWTMKEALLKARGLGIGEDLGKIALVRGWTDPRAVITRSPRLASQGRCSVVMGRVPGGYALAVAAFGPLVSGEPSAAAQRRLALFDLRDLHTPVDGRTLADALVLPVKDARPTRTAQPRAAAAQPIHPKENIECLQ